LQERLVRLSPPLAQGLENLRANVITIGIAVAGASGIIRRSLGARSDCRVIVQNYIQERVMDLQIAVVFDETQLAEFVHEEAHTRASGADHLGKSGLADFC
jgi:hypothetical protein